MRSIYLPLIEYSNTKPWPSYVSQRLLELGTLYPYCFNWEQVINKCETIDINRGIEQP